MFQIKPILVEHTSQEANNIEITTGASLTSATSCDIFYVLLNSITTTDEQGVETTNTIILSEGSIRTTETQYAEWGSDNTYIENIVLENLGIERIIVS